MPRPHVPLSMGPLLHRPFFWQVLPGLVRKMQLQPTPRFPGGPFLPRPFFWQVLPELARKIGLLRLKSVRLLAGCLEPLFLASLTRTCQKFGYNARRYPYHMFLFPRGGPSCPDRFSGKSYQDLPENCSCTRPLVSGDFFHIAAPFSGSPVSSTFVDNMYFEIDFSGGCSLHGIVLLLCVER